MKNLILWMLLFGFISTGHSQILLKEAKVDYIPESMTMDANTNKLVIKIAEDRAGEFQSNPLSFVKNKFDVQKLVRDNKRSLYNSYIVHFKSGKGNLLAKFDNDGTLISSYQNFKDIRLPEEARLQIVSKYRDAAIVSNKYVAYSKGWDLTKEMYKVKIKENGKTKRIKINKQDSSLSLAIR